MADDHTWREKLRALQKLEKPTPNHAFPPLHPKFSAKTPRNTTRQGGPRRLPIALQISLPLSSREPTSYRDVEEALPECLDTFSDFYDPRVSTNEKFEKYLMEMARRENGQAWRSVEERAGLRHKGCNRLIASYTPGSKGGGWKVVPNIQSSASSTCSMSTTRLFTPNGSHIS